MQSKGEEKASRGNSLYKVTNSRKKLGVVAHIISPQPSSVSAIAVVDGPCELKLTSS